MRAYSQLSALTLALLALSSAQVMAQNTGPKTRAEVKAELMEAIRTGNMPANDDTGRMLNEVNPSAYPPKAIGSTKSRAQVKSELEDAKRTGNIPANDETGLMLKEEYPNRYPAK